MKEVFLYFLKLGCLGFGGPIALVAQMQRELIHEKKWMPEEEFRQTFGLIKAMPGPVAFQTAVFLGHHRKGFFGGLAAAFGMVFPSFLLMVLLARFYESFHRISWIEGAMKGMAVAAFALVAWALKSLSHNFLKEMTFWLLLIAGIGLSLFTAVPEPVMILIFGASAVLALRKPSARLNSVEGTLAIVCFKAGAFVFGTGLAIVPFLENDFVRDLNWLTHQQFMDALSFGQLTPGPVVITVAFIGFKVAGLSGAALATVSIFLPAFFHMVSWFPRMVHWMKRQRWIQHFTLGVTAAVCSAIVVALGHIAKDWSVFEILAVGAALLVLRFSKIPSWGLILLSGCIGSVVFIL